MSTRRKVLFNTLFLLLLAALVFLGGRKVYSVMAAEAAHTAWVKNLNAKDSEALFEECAALAYGRYPQHLHARMAAVFRVPEAELGPALKRLQPLSVHIGNGSVYATVRGGFDDLLAVEYVSDPAWVDRRNDALCRVTGSGREVVFRRREG